MSDGGDEHDEAAATPGARPPTSRMADDSAVGTSFGWVPKTRMARFVSVIDVASVAMSCTCHVRARIVRITVRSYAEPEQRS